MSQFGMQMPGGRMKRTASMNVYTGLMFLAVMSLLAACGFMWFAGGKIGPDGNPLGIHEKTIKLAAPAK